VVLVTGGTVVNVFRFSLGRILLGLPKFFPDRIHKGVEHEKDWIIGRSFKGIHHATDVHVDCAVNQLE
jgi:hypothetical protein